MILVQRCADTGNPVFSYDVVLFTWYLKERGPFLKQLLVCVVNFVKLCVVVGK